MAAQILACVLEKDKLLKPAKEEALIKKKEAAEPLGTSEALNTNH